MNQRIENIKLSLIILLSIILFAAELFLPFFKMVIGTLDLDLHSWKSRLSMTITE